MSTTPVANTAYNTVSLEQPVIAGTAIAADLVEAGVIEKRPFMTSQEKELWQTIIFSPISIVAWLLAQPINIFTWIVIKVRTRRYDPEKVPCPACGFKGDKGTAGKSCRVAFSLTAGHEKAAIQHFCNRCGCDKFFTPLAKKADIWMAKVPLSTLRIE